MPEDWRIELEKQSNAALETFVTKNPKFSVNPTQPAYRGGTNFITFGHYDLKPIVFKYFVRNYRWQNEYFCLRYFAKTGYVPRILAVVPEQLIVMTRLLGQGLGQEDLSSQSVQQVSYQIGQALAAFAQTPLPEVESGYSPVSDFKCMEWGTDLREVLKRYLMLCRAVQEVIPTYQTPFFTKSLTLVESQIDVISKQPRILFHEDIRNMIAHRGTFVGFYDLEMCRLGTEAMQLGVAVRLCKKQEWHSYCLDWKRFIDGYQRVIERELAEEDFLSILAMSHFYHHIRVCRWAQWDGDPTQEHHMRASSDYADAHLEDMRAACEVLRDWVNLSRWFPS